MAWKAVGSSAALTPGWVSGRRGAVGEGDVPVGRTPAMGVPVGGGGGIGVHTPVAIETFFGGSDGLWGARGAMDGWICVNDGRVWMVYEEAVAFANDSAKKGKGFWDIVGWEGE